MAIGDTVQAGLLKADFSPIERGGAAKGRAYRAIGEGIGSALDKFAKNKQEGEAAEMGINAMIAGMDDQQKEELLSGESKLGKTYNKFLDGELSNSQKKAFLGGLATYNTTYRQNMADQMAMDKFAIEQAEERRRADLYQRGLNQYKQDQIKANIYDKFLGSREMVDMPVGGFDPNPLMRGVPQSTVRVPEGEYKGNRFLQTEQGKSDFTSLVDAGMDRSDALEMASKREAQLLASQPKAPDPFKLSDEIRKATEFQQGQDAITFKPERNTIVLGDTAYGISGKFGNEAEVIKLKSVEIPNYSNMNSVMNQLISLGEKRKTTKFMSNADKTLAQSLSNQLRGLLREQILGPGTVTDPERAILNEIVLNPTTWMDTAGNTQSKIDSLKGIRKDAFNKLKTRLTGLGLNVAEIGQGDESSPSKSSVNFDQETPSGLGYTEINLDQL
jgi:hypothetical protein